jgi:hypothetical protein
VTRRMVARVLLVILAVLVVTLVATADDRPVPIEIPAGQPTVWVTSTTTITPTPEPPGLVEVAHRTGVAT